jgi:hypothetical protein
MLLGVLVNTLYIKETENGQVTFFILLTLLLSGQYFRIRAPLHAQITTDCYFHNDPPTFFQAYMHFFFFDNLIYFHVIPPKLINQLNCILIKFLFILNRMTAKISSHHNEKRFVSLTTRLLILLYLFRKLYCEFEGCVTVHFYHNN